MDAKKTLFSYLYGELASQIESGRLAQGQALPSARQLCERYSVGIRTARDVLAALRAAGYIETRERRCAVVTYREDTSRENGAAIRALLARREAVADAFATMAVLAPPLFAFCARRCDERELQRLQRAYLRADRSTHKGDWRASSAVLGRLLAKAENPLLTDLYASLELYTQLPVFAGYENPYVRASSRHPDRDFTWVLASLPEAAAVQRRFGTMYRAVGEAVAAYLKALAADCPGVTADPAQAYRWDAFKGRVYTYAELGRDLLARIRAGEYPDGSFLPAAGVLAAAYGVSLATVRQALFMLQELGLVQVLNGRGTRVTLAQMKLAAGSLTRPGNRRDALLYLQGMQFMVLALPVAAPLAFPHIGAETAQRVARQVGEQGNTALTPLIGAVIDALPLAALQVIFRQMDRLLQRGIYLLYLQGSQVRRNMRTVFYGCRAAAEALQAGDSDAFVRQLTECYRFILERARTLFLGAGLPEAASVRIP